MNTVSRRRLLSVNHGSERAWDERGRVDEAQSTLQATLQRFEIAKKKGKLNELRACLCNDAVIELAAADGGPLGPNEAAEAVRTALERDPYYLEGQWESEQLDPDVVLTATPVREKSEHGIRHRTVFRLTVGRDGLIWRQRLFATRGDALAHFEKHSGG